MAYEGKYVVGSTWNVYQMLQLFSIHWDYWYQLNKGGNNDEIFYQLQHLCSTELDMKIWL